MYIKDIKLRLSKNYCVGVGRGDGKRYIIFEMKIRSTLINSKLKGPSEILRDIRSSTYQIFRTEEF